MNIGMFFPCSGNFFHRKSTIGTTIAAIEANNVTRLVSKTNRKVPADHVNLMPLVSNKFNKAAVKLN